MGVQPTDYSRRTISGDSPSQGIAEASSSTAAVRDTTEVVKEAAKLGIVSAELAADVLSVCLELEPGSVLGDQIDSWRRQLEDLDRAAGWIESALRAEVISPAQHEEMRSSSDLTERISFGQICQELLTIFERVSSGDLMGEISFGDAKRYLNFVQYAEMKGLLAPGEAMTLASTGDAAAIARRGDAMSELYTMLTRFENDAGELPDGMSPGKIRDLRDVLDLAAQSGWLTDEELADLLYRKPFEEFYVVAEGLRNEQHADGFAELVRASGMPEDVVSEGRDLFLRVASESGLEGISGERLMQAITAVQWAVSSGRISPEEQNRILSLSYGELLSAGTRFEELQRTISRIAEGIADHPGPQRAKTYTLDLLAQAGTVEEARGIWKNFV